MQSDLKPKFLPVPEDRQKVEVMRRLADVSKAKREIGFVSEVSLRDGLKHLVEWLGEKTGV